MKVKFMEKLKVKLNNILNGLTIRESLEATGFTVMGDLEAILGECCAMVASNRRVPVSDLCCDLIREDILCCATLEGILKVINHDAYKLLNDCGYYATVVSFDGGDEYDNGDEDVTYSDRLEAQMVNVYSHEEKEYTIDDLANADISTLSADQLRAFACLMAEQGLITLPDDLKDFCANMKYNTKKATWTGGKILKGSNYANAVANLRDFLAEVIEEANESKSVEPVVSDEIDYVEPVNVANEVVVSDGDLKDPVESHRVTCDDRKDTAEPKRVMSDAWIPMDTYRSHMSYVVSNGYIKDPIGYYKVSFRYPKDTAKPKRVLLGSWVPDGSIRIPMDTYGCLMHPP